MAETPLNSRSSPILAACGAGDIVALERLFSASGISAGNPPITRRYDDSTIPTRISNSQGPIDLPQTYEMLTAAVEGRQGATIKYLFTIFPEAHIQEVELKASIHTKDLAIFKLLADHAKDRNEVIDREFDDRYTSLSLACLGEKPDIALFLLDKGADPNEGSPLLGIGGPLANAIQEQPVQLIKKLVEKGAVINNWQIYVAVQKKRADVVKFLVEKAKGLDLKIPLEEAKKIGSKEILALLEKRG